MKTPKRWLQIIVWLWHGAITFEEGLFLLGQAGKRIHYGWPRKGYSLR
ncbi:MAG: hypothetical protein GX081_02045 [Firmicutes bacterium]|nr:hypothetical protein [Bacillota bacterium]